MNSSAIREIEVNVAQDLIKNALISGSAITLFHVMRLVDQDEEIIDIDFDPNLLRGIPGIVPMKLKLRKTQEVYITHTDAAP